MSRRRLNSIGSLIDGFNAGYGMVTQVARDVDLAKVAGAKVEELPGNMPPPNRAEVDKMTEAGGGYPEAGPINAATGGPRGASKYALLGTTRDTPFTPDQVTKLRQEAQAGVLEKHGDLEGAGRMRDRIAAGELRAFQMGEAKKSSERGDKLFQWQTEDRERLQKERDDEKAYKTGLHEIFSGSPVGQRTATYAKEMQEWHGKQQAYEEALRRGDPNAVAPTQPKAPGIGPAEMLSYGAKVLMHNATHGKATPEMLMSFGEKMRKTMEEGTIGALREAQGGASVDRVVALFNERGQEKLDPSKVVDGGFVERGNGLKSRIIKIQREDGSYDVIDTLASLDGFREAGDYYQRAVQQASQKLALRADARASAAEGRAQANFNAGAGQREAEAALGQAQAAIINAKTPEERAAATDRLRLVREGLSAGAPAPAPNTKFIEEQRVKVFNEALKANFNNVEKATQVANDAIERLFPGQSGRAPAASGASAGTNGPAPGAGPQPPANIPRINTPAEAAALPPGSQYVAPDGSIRQTGPRPPRAAAGGALPQQPAPAALAPGAGGAPAGQRSAATPAAAAPAGPAEPPQAAAFDRAREEVRAARLQLKLAREAMLRYGSRQRQADPEGFEAAKRAVAAAEAEVLAAQGRSAEAQAAYEQAMTAGPYMADAGARRLQ